MKFGYHIRDSQKLGAKALIQSDDYLNLMLDAETHPDVKLLRDINRLGFITDNSQDGLIEPIKTANDLVLESKIITRRINRMFKQRDTLIQKGKEVEPEEEAIRLLFIEAKNEYRSKGGTYRSEKMLQRAYLTGVVDKDLGFLLQYHLNKTDKVAIVDRVPVTYRGGSNFPGLHRFDNQFLRSQVPNVTNLHMVGKEAQPRQILRETLPKDVFKAHPDAYKRMIVIQCFDPTPGRKASGKDGLFTEVHKTLTKINKQLSEFLISRDPNLPR